MLYLKLARDPFEQMLAQIEFGEAIPGLDARFGGNPHLRLIPAYAGHYSDKILLLEKETASWCFLTPREYAVCQGLDDQDLQQAARLLALGKDELSEFVLQLYCRGLLKVNGHRYYVEDLYADGPIAVRSPLFLMVITERCNLTCRYCFAESGPAKGNGFAPLETARVLDLIVNYPSSYVTVEFAGGEPLLAADQMHDFVVRTRERCEALGKQVQFLAQSNGTLLTADLADLIATLDIRLGLSLDGSPDLNDRTRVFQRSKGTYAAIERGIRTLREREVKFGVICVVSRENCSHLNEVLDHFEELGLRQVKLNPVFRIGRADDVWSALAVEPEEYLAAHQRYLEYARLHPQPVIDENAAYVVRRLASKVHPYRCMRSQCGAGSDFFTFTPQGEIFPCSRYRSHPELCLGKVTSVDRLDQAQYHNPVLVELAARSVATIPECRDCLYKRFCEAGCPLDSYYAFGTATAPHPWCEYYRSIYPSLFALLAETPQLAVKLSPQIEIYDRAYFAG